MELVEAAEQPVGHQDPEILLASVAAEGERKVHLLQRASAAEEEERTAHSIRATAAEEKRLAESRRSATRWENYRAQETWAYRPWPTSGEVAPWFRRGSKQGVWRCLCLDDHPLLLRCRSCPMNLLPTIRLLLDGHDFACRSASR